MQGVRWDGSKKHRVVPEFISLARWPQVRSWLLPPRCANDGPGSPVCTSAVQEAHVTVTVTVLTTAPYLHCGGAHVYQDLVRLSPFPAKTHLSAFLPSLM